MFTYRELLSFIRLHGAMPIMATDKSGMRPAEHINEDSYDLVVAKLAQLKDGPKRNWTYSVEVQHSK